MPRPLHHGRPGSAVIPADWTAGPAAVVGRTLDCTVTIGPPGGTPVRNPVTRRVETPDAPPVYAGPASVSMASTAGSGEGQRVEAADDLVETRVYTVRLPAGAGDDVQVDHVVVVDAAPSSALVGARLVVTGVATPAREFSRVLTARLHT